MLFNNIIKLCTVAFLTTVPFLSLGGLSEEQMVFLRNLLQQQDIDNQTFFDEVREQGLPVSEELEGFWDKLQRKILEVGDNNDSKDLLKAYGKEYIRRHLVNSNKEWVAAILWQFDNTSDELFKELCLEGIKDFAIRLIGEIQAILADDISLSEQQLSSINKIVLLKLKFNSKSFKDINSFKDFVLDLFLNASLAGHNNLLASANPGQAFKVSHDGNSLVPFYPAGAFSFYAYLKPDSPFTTQKGKDWSIVPLNAVMYDSTNSFDISSHSFSVPFNGLWLFVAKVLNQMYNQERQGKRWLYAGININGKHVGGARIFCNFSSNGSLHLPNTRASSDVFPVRCNVGDKIALDFCQYNAPNAVDQISNTGETQLPECYTTALYGIYIGE